jgi:hypothetical protein
VPPTSDLIVGLEEGDRSEWKSRMPRHYELRLEDGTRAPMFLLTVAAEMTLDPVLAGVVRDLAERRELRGAAKKPTELGRIQSEHAWLRRGHRCTSFSSCSWRRGSEATTRSTAPQQTRSPPRFPRRAIASRCHPRFRLRNGRAAKSACTNRGNRRAAAF